MLMTFDDQEKRKGFKHGKLDLLSDSKMEDFFSRGIGGGQSFISQRKTEGEKNPEKSGHHLLYVDGKTIFYLSLYFIFSIFSFVSANNLYGSMETLKLPVSNFRWVPPAERKRMTAESILKIPPQDDIGYAFEVDLEYPEHLHKVNK